MREMRWDAARRLGKGSGSNMRLWLPKKMIMIYLFHKTSNITKKEEIPRFGGENETEVKH